MAPPPAQIWDRVDLATAGFTPGGYARAVFGVVRQLTAIVWHDTEGDSVEGAVATWDQGNACAHLTVGNGEHGDGDGEIVLTCLIPNVAWHAGTDQYTGRTPFWQTHNVNPYSVGIELVGHYLDGYTAAQVRAAKQIARWAQLDLGIELAAARDALTGHLTHAAISNQRSDPGWLFPLSEVLAG